MKEICTFENNTTKRGVKKHSIEKRFVGLIIGGIALFVGVVGIGIGSAALHIANQNEKKIDVIQQQLKSLEEKALNIKKFLDDQFCSIIFESAYFLQNIIKS